MRLSKNGKIKLAVAGFLILVVLLYFLIYVAPGISDIFVETYTAEYGTLDVDYSADCVAVRTERLYTADYPGAVTRVANPGDLKTVSSNIVNVGGTAYYCQERGVVGYQYDGMETVLTPETMMEVGPSSLHPAEDENGQPVYELKDCVSADAIAGDPVYKIYDNQTWYLLTFLDKDTAKAVRDAGAVTVELPDESKTKLKFRVHYVDEIQEEGTTSESADDSGNAETNDGAGNDEPEDQEPQEPQGTAGVIKSIGEDVYSPKDLTVDSKITQTVTSAKTIVGTALEAKDQETAEGTGDQETSSEPTDDQAETEDQEKLYRVILSCNRYYSELGSLRYATVRIITAQKTGIILENGSITQVDGKKGVYVVNKYGDYVFTPISIISVVGDKTVVESHTFYDRETDTTYYTVDNYDKIKKRGGGEDVDQG